MTTEQISELYHGLRHFSGSETITRHYVARRLCFTEGVDYLRRKGAAFWLVDAIASYYGKGGQIDQQNERFQSLHFWTLSRHLERGAMLRAAEDQGFDPAVEQLIEYTDFPFDESGEFKLYCALTATESGPAWLLMLPGEY